MNGLGVRRKVLGAANGLLMAAGLASEARGIREVLIKAASA